MILEIINSLGVLLTGALTFAWVGVFVFIFGLAGGWISRMCGGASPKLPLGLDAWLYALPIVGLCAYISAPWFATLPAYLLGVLGKRLGHGQYMDLGSVAKIIKPEKIDFVVKALFGKDINETQAVPGSYKRDWVGLALTGLVTSIGAGVCVAVYGESIILAILVVLSGALKAGAYSIGRFMDSQGMSIFNKHKELEGATEVGEFLTGFIFYVTLFMAFLWM